MARGKLSKQASSHAATLFLVKIIPKHPKLCLRAGQQAPPPAATPPHVQFIPKHPHVRLKQQPVDRNLIRFALFASQTHKSAPISDVGGELRKRA